jgi:hypothetical protein
MREFSDVKKRTSDGFIRNRLNKINLLTWFAKFIKDHIIESPHILQGAEIQNHLYLKLNPEKFDLLVLKNFRIFIKWVVIY